MGVYHGVANYTKKEYIYDPNDLGVKWWPIFHPDHPMARLVLYKIYSDWSEDSISLVTDSYEFPWENDTAWTDVTAISMRKYIDGFSHPKDPENDEYMRGFINHYSRTESSIPRGWISVKDKLPEYGQRVMAIYTVKGVPQPVCIFRIYCCHKKWDMQADGYDISHWYPLPEFPK